MRKIGKLFSISVFSLLAIGMANIIVCDPIICTKPRKMWLNAMQVGDGIAHYSLAK